MIPQQLTLLLLSISSVLAKTDLPYTSDFENREGFADEVSLSGDWAATDDAVVIVEEADAVDAAPTIDSTAVPAGGITFKREATLLFRRVLLTIFELVLDDIDESLS